MATFSGRLKGEFWRPEERRVWMRKRLGWGWTINFAELSRRALGR